MLNKWEKKQAYVERIVTIWGYSMGSCQAYVERTESLFGALKWEVVLGTECHPDLQRFKKKLPVI